jgi:hypothetical protein
MANIAEGFGRNSVKDFAHFLDTARGSVNEVQSLLYVALDIHYVEGCEFERLYQLAEDTASIIGGLTRYLRGRAASVESRDRRPAGSVKTSIADSSHPMDVHSSELHTRKSELKV